MGESSPEHAERGAPVIQSDSLGSLSELVDPRVGIIRSVVRLSKGREEPELPIVYQATLSNFDYRKGGPIERTASGKGRTDDAAMRGAIAEALERYCAYQPRENAISYSGTAALDAPAIMPEEFVLYSERQYARATLPYRRPPAGEPINWVAGRRVGSEEPIYAPASLVYMNFAGAGGRELFTLSTSNGLAAGPDLPSAILSGFCELIERDAFVVTWLNRLPVPRIDFSSLGGISQVIQRHYEHFGIETIAFDITTDIPVTVVMALALDRSGNGPSVVVGLGCHLSPAIALEKALMEICQIRAGAVPRYRHQPRKDLKFYEDVRTLEDHAAFSALPERRGEFAFLLNTPRTERVEEIPDQSRMDSAADLEICRLALEAAGSIPAYVDLTQPDLEPYAIRVVRCIATGLQPISFGFGHERLGGRRLFTLPRLLGYIDRETSEDELNPCPHPLA